MPGGSGGGTTLKSPAVLRWEWPLRPMCEVRFGGKEKLEPHKKAKEGKGGE